MNNPQSMYYCDELDPVQTVTQMTQSISVQDIQQSSKFDGYPKPLKFLNLFSSFSPCINYQRFRQTKALFDIIHDLN